MKEFLPVFTLPDFCLCRRLTHSFSAAFTGMYPEVADLGFNKWYTRTDRIIFPGG